MEIINRKIDDDTVEITTDEIIKKTSLLRQKQRIEEKRIERKLDIDTRDQNVLDDINSKLTEFER